METSHLDYPAELDPPMAWLRQSIAWLRQACAGRTGPWSTVGR